LRHSETTRHSADGLEIAEATRVAPGRTCIAGLRIIAARRKQSADHCRFPSPFARPRQLADTTVFSCTPHDTLSVTQSRVSRFSEQ